MELSEAIEQLKEATEALKKQIPKYPDIEGDAYDDLGNLIYDTWICPSCNMHYEIDYHKYNYCTHCGQRINREELEKLEE